MLLGLSTIIGGTNPRAVVTILLFVFFALAHIVAQPATQA